MASVDTAFTGSVPATYDRLLGPLLFEPYAQEVARRARALMPGHVLETAAGTGILTERLHQALPDANIIATDLNPAMLEVAARRIRSDKVSFETADAQDLRFADAIFDLVVCQFGVMFFPDKVRGYKEAFRVLRDGGRYIAVIWDRLEHNPASKIVHDAVAALYPDDPPQFFARTPFGYSDPDTIERDMRAAGFRHVDIDTLVLKSRESSPRDAAVGLVTGCPLRSEIEERDPAGLERAVDAACEALKALGGAAHDLDSRLSAHVVTAIK
jgi:ubiquinone/menaquinone biosynthesis C-methylase UbiE